MAHTRRAHEITPGALGAAIQPSCGSVAPIETDHARIRLRLPHRDAHACDAEANQRERDSLLHYQERRLCRTDDRARLPRLVFHMGQRVRAVALRSDREATS